MNIAVLSGKGGTGKTFVSVNLASVIKNAAYIDCDVEEPNGHLFFKPEQVKSEPVYVLQPEIDKTKCSGCRKCVDFCKFNALAFVGGVPIKFKDVCHSCGGCKSVCPQKAIRETNHQIGEIKTGKHSDTKVISGILNTGEESGVPIIRKLLTMLNAKVNIIDCPPGSACSVMESIREADYCILVAEPTLFGAHNFEMVHELVAVLNKPFGVVLNKVSETDNPMEQLCRKKNLPVLARILYDTALAEHNAEGRIASETAPEMKTVFETIFRTAAAEVTK